MGEIMKKLLLAGLMALGAIGSVNAGDSFFGGFAGGATGSLIGGALRPRDKTVVVDRGGRGDRGYVRQLERENDDLRRRLERLEEKMDKRGRW